MLVSAYCRFRHPTKLMRGTSLSPPMDPTALRATSAEVLHSSYVARAHPLPCQRQASPELVLHLVGSKIVSKCVQNGLEMFSKHFQNIFKMFFETFYKIFEKNVKFFSF